MDIVLTILGGAAGAAFVTGIMSIILYRMKRRDQNDDNKNVTRKALRYIMLTSSRSGQKTTSGNRKYLWKTCEPCTIGTTCITTVWAGTETRMH